MTNDTLIDLFPQYITSSIINDPSDILFKKIEFSILTDKCFKEKKREMMASLYQWKASQQIKHINSSDEQRQKLDLIRTINGITEDDFYIYGPAVPLTSYTYAGTQHTNDDIMAILQKYNIGITRFKILKSDVILNVWCEGDHLNVNPEDDTFCYEPKCVPFSKECIQQLMILMSTVNLNNCYKSKPVYKAIVREIFNALKQQGAQ